MPSVELNSIVEMLTRSVPDFGDDIHEVRSRFADLAAKSPVDSGILLHERRVGAVHVLETTHSSDLGTTILFFHGGGYVAGSAAEALSLSSRLGVAADTKVISVDYRLAPEDPYPAGVQDALSVYAQLLGDGASPESIVVAGASAGGGLALSLLLAAKAQGLSMPAACVVFSPWVDLELRGESISNKADVDPSLTPQGLRRAATDYLHGRSPRHAGANALHADLTGLPPLLIQVGSREILFDDAVRLAARAGAAEVEVELQSWPEMVHVFQAFSARLPEGQQALNRAGDFIRRHTGRHQTP